MKNIKFWILLALIIFLALTADLVGDVVFRPSAPHSVTKCDQWLARAIDTKNNYWSNLAIACYLSHLVDRSEAG